MSQKSFAQAIRPDFRPRDIEAGGKYCRDGRVRTISIDDLGAEFQVAGSEDAPYRVTFDWEFADDGEVSGACTCPRWADAGICKHQFAAALEADLSARVPERVLRKRRLRLEMGDESEEEAYDDEDESDSGTLEWYDASRRSSLPDDAFPKSRPSAREQLTRRRTWQEQIEALSRSFATTRVRAGKSRSERRREAWFVIDRARSLSAGGLVLTLCRREERTDGTWGKLKQLGISPTELRAWSDEDREALELLFGGRTNSHAYYQPQFSEVMPLPAVRERLLPQLAARGRLLLRADESVPLPQAAAASYDVGPPLRMQLSWERAPSRGAWRLHGRLVRENEAFDASAVEWGLDDGMLCIGGRLLRLQRSDDVVWLRLLRECASLEIAATELDDFVESCWSLGPEPPLTPPESGGWSTASPEPVAQVCFQPRRYDQRNYAAHVRFHYDDQAVEATSFADCVVDRKARRIVRRNREQERKRLLELISAGVQESTYSDDGAGLLPMDRVPKAAAKLLPAGWRIEVAGKPLRSAERPRLRVRSGVDWFELAGSCRFDEQTIGLPELLRAARQGKKLILLDDGSHGMLPEDWLKKFGALAALGDEREGGLRFRRSQGLLLDALLAEQGDVRADKSFDAYRARLGDFAGIRPLDQPATFQGSLREYQRIGLGWFEFLREFGLGGCLADDMGLGKTVQLLALLERRRLARKPRSRDPRTSLIVVPRSLAHNWLEEAERFTPELRVAEYHGTAREKALPENVELIVTTYGMLRQDIELFREREFDYVVLDEAQAIKNADSLSAKAARLLRARHRLALTGTPVENRLAELWSIVEFLNPGMLGRLRARRDAGRFSVDDDTQAFAARALRPLLLRRTKAQVLRELPKKTEQTLYCELMPKQRRLYDELRDHYRAALERRIADAGLAKSKIVVLEALLRLRQAACHPGLLDPKQIGEPSAKLDCLLEQLSAVVAEGHKTLVFSQFTSLLALVKQRLDAAGIRYAYLDGKTKKRQEEVEWFQSEPELTTFLISLKAGGVGLNLTAADYVFILDPWWNPAVEAQAVDRAHRLGQERRVFAYRLIASDTVEEKILQLQNEKRRLAEAIVSVDNGLISKLTVDDLRLLLS